MVEDSTATERAIVDHLSLLRRDSSCRTAELINRVLEERPHESAAQVLALLGHLASPFSLLEPLIDPQGNLGSPLSPASDPRFSEISLTPFGHAVAACAKNATFPLHLLIGSAHRGGAVPPFPIARALGAVTADLESTPPQSTATKQLCQVLGLPAFPSGCHISGSFDAAASGGRSLLRLTATSSIITHEFAGLGIEIRHLPNWWQVEAALSLSLPSNARWINLSQNGSMRLFVAVASLAQARTLRQQLMATWPFAQTFTAHLGEPWIEPWRRWLRNSHDAAGELETLREALTQPRPDAGRQ